MTDFAVAFGLVLVIEGALYTLFPGAMTRMMAQVMEMPPTQLRAAGLFAAVVGLGVVWLVRG